MATLAKLSNTVSSASVSNSSSFSSIALLHKRPCFSASFASQPFLQQTSVSRTSWKSSRALAGFALLESVTSLEKLFYHTVAGRGEYANLMNKEENVDFHLLNKVKSAKFAKGKSMTGDIPTYSIRFLDDEDKAAALFLVMWKPTTKGEYDEGQVEAFESLLSKHGDTCYFKQ